ncbi:polysaccharide biosynthesis/export family protein [Desulfurivibrio alkaliphilus]|uniref:Polysaccharide export protein n=1 Tax=Desulfurivibrio alkaliphilus (strain DSM 19089 / UNIQEM U267 / AHT2) TaxID=589865 RepID=D6Z4F1_DESAT|nr:polysaccharide biosynthesis/export family protein [Desulfurivibrio alkaliphilus]ADH86426.1 polysaccharide export protein [Desulfurivibrio alkaliphilus AHT 2]
MKVSYGVKILTLLVAFFLFPPTPFWAWAGNDPSAQATADNLPPEYLIGIGDVLEIQVWREPELTRTTRVRLDGRISLPLAGDIAAVGHSPQQLADQLKQHYRQKLTDPEVTVILAESKRRYYVIGQVRQPGEFPLDGNLTVLQALARSGGFLEWAKTSDITVIRPSEKGEQIIPFNYNAITSKRGRQAALPLAPGDTIVVP